MSIEFEKGLVALLDGTADAYPRLPQRPTYPLVKYTVIYVTRDTSVDNQAAGVTEVGLQIDCMAETYEAVKTLADSVRGVMHRYQGAWGTLTARLVLLQTENDLSSQDGDRVTHWVSQRYQVWTNMD